MEMNVCSQGLKRSNGYSLKGRLFYKDDAEYQTGFPSLRSPDGDCCGGVSPADASRRSDLNGIRPRPFSGDATLLDSRSVLSDCADPNSSSCQANNTRIMRITCRRKERSGDQQVTNSTPSRGEGG